MTKPSKKGPTSTIAPETKTVKFPGGGSSTDLGLLPPEDRVYSRGPIVAGREILKPPKAQPSKPGTHTRGGFLPLDHPIFSTGPIVSGRPILQPPKKKTD